jgi:TonB family protein
VLQIDREIVDLRLTPRGWGASLLLHVLAAGVLLSVTVPTAHERRRVLTAIYLPRILSPAGRHAVRAPHRSIPTPKAHPIPESAPISRPPALPRIETPVAELPPAPVAAALPPVLEPITPPELPARQRIETATGLFEPFAAKDNVRQAGAQVQIGGFDSTLDVMAKPTRTLSSAASFGDGGQRQQSHPAPRIVSSSQFDAVSTMPAIRRTGIGARVSEAIEILAKPKPIYTEEARRLRIEGEVVLEVLFRASAQVCVLRVVKGLGHGLDASAERAAMGIRFHPAAEAGRAVDSVATVKIEFQLAD